MAIIWIGLPILLLMLLAVYGLTGFERLLAIHVLDQDIVPMRDSLPEETAWQWLKGILTTPATWKGFFFLLLKMPLGIFSFSLTVTLLAISLSFVLAPIVVLAGGVIDLAFLEVDTLPEALLSSLVGVFLHVIALHILNVLARGWGQLARALLGKTYV